jgi:mono/diheme cytochrome c family protein
MKKTQVLGTLVFGAIATLGVTLYATEQEPEHPSKLFKEYCAKCHGDDGKADTFKGKHLKARNFTDAEWQAGESDSDLIKSVTEGKDDMPPFGKKLTPEQIEGLVKNDVRGFAPKKS